MPIDDMDRFEQKEMKKKIPIKNNWYDWLSNHILKHVRETVGGFKTKVITLFKRNTTKKHGKQTVYGSRNRPSKFKLQK